MIYTPSPIFFVRGRGWKKIKYYQEREKYPMINKISNDIKRAEIHARKRVKLWHQFNRMTKGCHSYSLSLSSNREECFFSLWYASPNKKISSQEMALNNRKIKKITQKKKKEKKRCSFFGYIWEGLLPTRHFFVFLPINTLLPLDNRTRIRIRLPVEGGQHHSQNDAG
jgi:hypothetical protein